MVVFSKQEHLPVNPFWAAGGTAPLSGAGTATTVRALKWG